MVRLQIIIMLMRVCVHQYRYFEQDAVVVGGLLPAGGLLGKTATR